MRRSWAIPLFFAGALLLAGPALAQAASGQTATPSPRDIQALIVGGEPGQAVKDLNNVLAVHPKSGVAWYLLAEAYDAQGDEADAAPALNMAARYSPGLPFANKRDLAAMRARIGRGEAHGGIGAGHTALLVIGGLILLLVVLRFMRGRSLAARNYGYMQPPPPPGTPPYGYGYGPQPGGGGGMGSALMGGLAAGAGFAAGERIIDGMMGRNEGFPQENGGFPMDGGASPDDGLMGNPGWGDGSSGDDDLNNSGWS